ncbi:hypothetical protein BLNAU_18822 [Blattamonas nauphoetae]|uniref:Uncharacterized protein n=1 Tax=Blattamonas nauphoetae TaxID=2049346 RepID=A0ABQ9X376_9EUKA|nr:hypothetical protein BLNAU_18822 [Blattamonas nauphoetae]
MQNTTLDDAIRNHGFTPVKVGTTMLHTFSLIIEHKPEEKSNVEEDAKSSPVMQLYSSPTKPDLFIKSDNG